MTLLRHRYYLSADFDLGFYVQNVWLIAHGEWHNTVWGFHVFADHFSPVLLFLAPLGYGPTAELLLITQGLALGLGMVPAFRLGELIGGGRLGALSVIWYGTSAALWHAAMWDFHPLKLGVPLLLWLMVTIERREDPWRVAVPLLTLFLVREDVAILGAIVVLQGAWHQRNSKLAVLGAGVSLAAIAYVVAGAEFFGFGPRVWFNLRYIDYGKTLAEVVANIPKSFPVAIERALRVVSVTAVVALLLPMLVLSPTIGWRRSWPGLLVILANIVAWSSSIYSQYFASAIPFLLWGGLTGWSTIERHIRGARRLAVTASVGCFVILGPFIFEEAGPDQNFLWTMLANRDRAQLDEALAFVPATTSVAASLMLVSHLAERREIYTAPGPFVCADWVRSYVPATRSTDYVILEAGDFDKSSIMRLQDFGYSLVYEAEEARVWKRGDLEPPSEPCPGIDEMRALMTERVLEATARGQ